MMRLKGFAPLILLLVIGVGIVGVYFLHKQGYIQVDLNPKQSTENTDTPTLYPSNKPDSRNSPTPTSDSTKNWKTYVNNKINFSIQYPNEIDSYTDNWVYEGYESPSADFSVGFGPLSSKSGGYIWSVNVYSSKTLEQIINEMGQQFKDRKETRENILIDNQSAVLVTVTTNEVENWVHKEIYIKQGNKIYAIGNGAIDEPEFEQFYKSFKFID